MSDFLYRRYQGKTNAQLQAILENQDQYQDNAVNAAVQILNERNDSDIEFIVPPETNRIQGKGFFDQIFDTTILRKTFGFQDMLTWLTLAFITNAFLEILNYYSDEPLIEPWFTMIFVSFIILASISNHIVFKSTYRWSNNVIGRIAHDLAYLFMLISLRQLYYHITSGVGYLNAENLIAILLVVFIYSFSLEFVVAILKRFFLTVFKWQFL